MSGGGASRTAGKRERRRSGVRWDEHNLTENEAIKARLQPIKIDEPKTPYHGPSVAEESDDGSTHMAPLMLEEEGGQEQDFGQASVSRENGDADRMEHMEARFSSGDMDAAAGASPRHASWEGSLSPGSYYSSEDEEGKAEKRRRFEERRKKHYQMTAAARELLHSTEVAEAAKTGGLATPQGTRQDQNGGTTDAKPPDAGPTVTQ